MLGVSCIQKLAKMKWIIAHNLNSKNIFVQVHDDNNDYVIPNSVTIIDQNTIEIYFNAPMAGTAQLLVVLDPVIVDIPDLNQPTFEFTFPTLSNVWHVQHDIGYLPITRVYNSEGVQITPYSIEHISTSNTVISFVKPRSGFVRMI
jgi:hypothetical protein